MKKILENMIIKWHQAGYSLDEIAPLVPQVPKAEIAAIIHQHDERSRNCPACTAANPPAARSAPNAPPTTGT